MFTSQSCVFAVNYQARALTPQKSSKERHRFLVGTCSLHDSNELSVLEYHENTNQIEATAIYNHPDQIWAIEPSPSNSDLLITSGQSSAGDKRLTLWRMPHQSADDLLETSTPIEDKLDLKTESTFEIATLTTLIQDIKWHPDNDKILTADSNRVSLWSLGESTIKVILFEISRTALCLSSIFLEAYQTLFEIHILTSCSFSCTSLATPKLIKYLSFSSRQPLVCFKIVMRASLWEI